MERTHAWAVVGKDGLIPMHWSEAAGCWLYCIAKTRKEARTMRQNCPLDGERVVRVVIEIMEE